MQVFFMIITWLAAAAFAVLSYPPLKESSEYRFQKPVLNFEGISYLVTALLIIFVSFWFIILGAAFVLLFKQLKK